MRGGGAEVNLSILPTTAYLAKLYKLDSMMQSADGGCGRLLYFSLLWGCLQVAIKTQKLGTRRQLDAVPVSTRNDADQGLAGVLAMTTKAVITCCYRASVAFRWSFTTVPIMIVNISPKQKDHLSPKALGTSAYLLELYELHRVVQGGIRGYGSCLALLLLAAVAVLGLYSDVCNLMHLHGLHCLIQALTHLLCRHKSLPSDLTP